jgi:alpha-glucosidase
VDADVLAPTPIGADTVPAAGRAPSPSGDDPQWWRSAVIYQIYVRSFADGNGDGTGDLAGVRSRLGYLRDLGIDAIWFTPWYPSPLADGGYDVSDYRSIHPDFGTLREAELLVKEALALGIRTIIDVVPNHVSDQHAWFQAALAAGPGGPERERFWFRDGGGPDGDEMPNHWVSPFAGETWTRTTNADGTPGQWYLHLFTPEQPDLNWRAVADSYPGTRVLVGEIWLPDVDRFVAYLRPDELHTAFNFDFLARPWSAPELRASIDQTLTAHAPVQAPSTWVLSNHDVTRPVTRYGRDDSSFAFLSKRFGTFSDRELGTRRARAAALLTAALPGSLYIYQGDELGLPEVEDIPLGLLQDPMHFRSQGVDPGRDGCRVPLPWSGSTAPYGFSNEHATGAPWLPQPAEWAAFTVEAEARDPRSMLSLYRAALAIRKDSDELGDGTLSWLDLGPDALAFQRGDDFLCITNFADQPLALPSGAALVLASEELVTGQDGSGELPPDSTAWLRTQHVALETPSQIRKA